MARYFFLDVRLKSFDLVYLLAVANYTQQVSQRLVVYRGVRTRPPIVNHNLIHSATLFYSFDVQGSTAKLTLIFPHV